MQVVGAVLLKNNHVILAQRSSTSKNFPNLFEFPGGKVEQGETHKEAIVRELKEELEIIVNNNDVFEFENNSSSHTIDQGGLIIDLTLFIINKWSGELTIKKNIHDSLAHVYIDNLNTFENMIPGDTVFIKPIQKYFINENIRKEKKCAYSRCSDQNYYLSKLLGKVYQMKYPNPEFTKEDVLMKHKIFEIPNNNTCFISGKDSSGVGDHIFEINGYFKRTGKRGINDQWNIVPVCGKLNKSYKIFKFNLNNIQVKKDIGCEDLTAEESCYLLSSDDEKEVEMGIIYYKMYMWKKYVKSRGAVMMYEETENFQKIRTKFKKIYNTMWDTTIETIITDLVFSSHHIH